jgi:hypothetical protein
MTMHDPFIGMGYGWGWRVRWLGAGPRPGGRPDGPGAPVRASYGRQLAKIERSLIADTPVLATKFAMFNQLTGGEQATGAEPLPARPSSTLPLASTLILRVLPSDFPGRTQNKSTRRAAYLTVLLALAAVVTLCLALSAHARTVVRPCHAVGGTGTSAPSPLRGASCAAYATTK